MDENNVQPPKPRGFAAVDPEVRRAISSKGGKAAHAAGVAHRWDSAAASEAGKKGGNAPHSRRGRQKLPEAP